MGVIKNDPQKVKRDFEERQETKNPRGRKPQDIDWDKVDQYIMAGATGSYIARAIGIRTETLYKRCEETYGKKFLEYREEIYLLGNENLQMKAYQMAVKGSVPTMIFLLKTRCGMKEEPKVIVKNENNIDFSALNDSEKLALIELLEKTKRAES